MSRRYSAPAIPGVSLSNPKSIKDFANAVSNILTVREGMLGDSLDTYVTFRDMFEAGLTKEYIDGVYQAWGGNNSTGTIPSTADGPANYDIPPAPTGLVAAAGIALNILQWTNPTTLYGNHSYTEIWRSATNNLGAAVKVGTATFHLYEDAIGTTNTTYYYWIRFVTKANKTGPYNAAAGAGTVGTTAYVVASNIFVTNLSAINADMGSITAGTITGGTIQTAASGARIVLNASNFIGYDAASVAKTMLSGSTGLLTAVDADITGTITATVGAIGGWTIGATALTAGSGATTVGLDSGGTNPALYAGSATPSTAPFRVTQAGALTAISGAIGGWTLGATSFMSGSGATTVGLDSGGTNPAVYAGSATPATAPFRVTNAGKLTATDANITGRVSASSFATSGSYLSVAALAAATTLSVYDTTDFASSGSGQIVDSTNDRDAFSWTGKTATTLTGCTGVLAHPIGASVVSLAAGAKSLLINDETNEIRFYGNRGDGVVEELASIGISSSGSDTLTSSFGTSTSSNIAIYARSNTNFAIRGISVSAYGVYGSSTSGVGVIGASSSNYGVYAGTSSTTVGPFFIEPKSNTTDPTTGTRGQFYVQSDGVLRFHDGTSWKTVTVV